MSQDGSLSSLASRLEKDELKFSSKESTSSSRISRWSSGDVDRSATEFHKPR
jgi:hypothetical protein